MNFIKNETPQKLRGGYYTDPDIALFLTRWVFEIDPQHLLEPSCGDGVFLEAINRANPAGMRSVVAVEKDASEAEKVIERSRTFKNISTKVIAEDFLQWSLLNINNPMKFDAVLGNPPFIRYQYLNNAQQSLMQKAFDLFQVPFTKHTNAWVPFILLSISKLRAGGRLAMVVPSELLHVLYAQPLRTFLATHCSKVLVIDPEELWFNNTLQGVVLLLAEKKMTSASKGHGVAITRVTKRKFLTEKPNRFFKEASFSNGDVVKGKWMLTFLNKEGRELLKDISERPEVHRFGDIANIDVGIVTGANKFFLVSDEVVAKYKLQSWAHPMFGRSEHARGVIYDEESHNENKVTEFPTNFLWFGTGDISSFPPSVQEYIKLGEAEDLHHRYKCRIRSPWYNVPSVHSTPVAMLKRSHYYPRLIFNKLNAYTTDTAYRIRPNSVEPQRLVYSFVNSLTALTAELEGRHYGGGVLELVPSEIERLLIPLPVKTPVSLEWLDQAIRSGAKAKTLFAIQNDTLLKEIGLNKVEQEILFYAWERLQMRRHRSQNKSEEIVEAVAATVSLIKKGTAVASVGA